LSASSIAFYTTEAVRRSAGLSSAAFFLVMPVLVLELGGCLNLIHAIVKDLPPIILRCLAPLPLFAFNLWKIARVWCLLENLPHMRSRFETIIIRLNVE